MDHGAPQCSNGGACIPPCSYHQLGINLACEQAVRALVGGKVYAWGHVWQEGSEAHSGSASPWRVCCAAS